MCGVSYTVVLHTGVLQDERLDECCTIITRFLLLGCVAKVRVSKLVSPQSKPLLLTE